MIGFIIGSIVGFIVGFIVASIAMASKAQQGYIFHSEGTGVKWTHRQSLERGIWDMSQVKKGEG